MTQGDYPFLAALGALAIQIIYLLLDYYILRSPSEDHGLLHYLERKLAARARARATINITELNTTT